MRSTNPDRQDRRTRVLLVDDHPLVRKALRDILCAEPDLVVCGEAEDHSTALDSIPATHPHLALVDLCLKSSDGLDLVRDLHTRWPAVKVLVISMHDESPHAERSLRAGALGYIRKQEPTSEILRAVRRVLSGKVYLKARIATQILRRLSTGPAQTPSPPDLLAARELQVFKMTGQGLNTRQIARQLRISAKTVETYRTRIREKLNCDPGQLLQQAIAWTHQR